MEIYHRDHWAIIVHMAPWYDLTKGTEENTSIDLISHIGRIVKRVLPVTPAFAPKARRLRTHMLDDPSQMIDPINYCVLFIPYGQIIPCGHMDNYDPMVSVIYLHL